MHKAIDKHADLRDGLYLFADNILSALFTPMALDLSRLAITDGIRFPELAKIYFVSGPDQASETLKELLDSAQHYGKIQCQNTALSASPFIGMLRDNLYLQVLLKLRNPPEEQERKMLVKNAVDIFYTE